jgi:hypothetical protein
VPIKKERKKKRKKEGRKEGKAGGLAKLVECLPSMGKPWVQAPVVQEGKEKKKKKEVTSDT